MKTLTPEQMAFYDEQGYIIIEDFISKEEIAELLGALDRLVEEKAKGMTKDEAGFNLQTVHEGGEQVNNFGGKIVAPGLLRKIQGITKHSPEFAAFAEGDKLLDVVEDLIGPTFYHHSSKLMFKPARHGTNKPWHQDYAYWASTKPEQITCWMALDDATLENGCMQLIPGSHKWGLVEHVGHELQVSEENIPMDQVQVAEMKAGALLAFHVLTLHYSAPNTSEKGRRSLIVDYDPNPRLTPRGLAGDRLLRIDGRKPTGEEVEAAANRHAPVTA